MLNEQSDFNAWIMGRIYNDFSHGWAGGTADRNPIQAALSEGFSTAFLDYGLFNPIGIYHKNCMDGTGAAAALLKALPLMPIVACSYGDPLPIRPHTSSYIFVDFSPTEWQLEELLFNGHRVLVVDHHKTAEESLRKHQGRKNFYLYFDSKRSGAALAWDLFLGYVPRLVEFVEDRDLWNWKLPGSKEVSAYLHLLQLYDKPDEFNKLVYKFDESEFKARGLLLLQQQTIYVDQVVARMRTVELQGKRVNYAFSAILQSEIGQELAKTADAGLVIGGMDGDVFTASFRSVDGESAYELATAYGGGGHPNAAGCRLPIGELK